jgi:hypothetical protein
MDVKEAVTRAKSYVADSFESENISNLGLEEVYFEPSFNNCVVTLGFSRPWDRNAVGLAAIAQQISAPPRSNKTLRIEDETGRITSLKTRETN